MIPVSLSLLLVPSDSDFQSPEFGRRVRGVHVVDRLVCFEVGEDRLDGGV